GKNYLDHAREMQKKAPSAAADEIPTTPIVFAKLASSVIGPESPIFAHSVTTQLDYEAELAVIIGKEGRGIRSADAENYIWGYTILNDVTARDLQKKHQQWLIGKSLDTFCPMGPWIVTADEMDGGRCRIQCWVNNELRQSSSTESLIFNIPT